MMRDCRFSNQVICQWDHFCKTVPHCFGMTDKVPRERTGGDVVRIDTDHQMVITLNVYDVIKLYCSMRTQKTESPTRVQLVEALYVFCQKLPEKIGDYWVPITARKPPQIYKKYIDYDELRTGSSVLV